MVVKKESRCHIMLAVWLQPQISTTTKEASGSSVVSSTVDHSQVEAKRSKVKKEIDHPQIVYHHSKLA